MKFTLRPWQLSDLTNLVKYANNENIAKFLTNKFPHPYTATDGKAFIEFATSEEPIHIFAIEVDGEAIGGIGIHPQKDIYIKNAELGYWIAEPFWGKGIISKAIPLIIDFGFRTFDINRIYAMTFEPNKGSQKVLENNNFVLDAKLDKTIFKNGELMDELIYSIRRENWKTN